MIINEIKKGQGLGNQLFCYVSTRCIAKDNGYDFGFMGTEFLGDVRYNSEGLYFMNLDMGKPPKEVCSTYTEHSTRVKFNTCYHDMIHGCDVRSYDKELHNVKDNTLIDGIMQDQKYFYHHIKDIKNWLKLKTEYDSYEFYKDNLCILNFRGGEYTNHPELFLSRNYWVNAMNNMLKLNPNMVFKVITDDVTSAKRMLPELECFHFDIAKDYASIKNSKYVILSNSTFACFPVFTSETIEWVIAPKYWSRHNLSNGYWATEQNLYQGWMWQDREGELYTYDQCVEELKNYNQFI
jgi:hypothetical protein